MSVIIRTIYDKHAPVSLDKFEESQTQQHFANEVNIHQIIERSKRGIVPVQADMRPPQFGDFSNIVDYQTAFKALEDSKNAFMSLPVEVRYRFGNSPAQLLTFISDEKNRQEAIELGLIEKPKDPEEEPIAVLKAIKKNTQKEPEKPA